MPIAISRASIEPSTSPLREHPLLASLDDQELRELGRLAVRRELKPREPVVVQGEVASSLFLLVDGEVGVERTGPDGVRDEVSRLLAPGHFGESSLLSGGCRSAGVRAVGPVVLYEIPADALVRLAEAGGGFVTMLFSLLSATVRRLGDATQRTVDELARARREGLERERIGRFILGTILGLVTYTTFIGTLGSAREMGLRPELVTSPILLFHVALVVWFIRRSRFPLAFFGLTLHRWPARAMEAIIWSLPILALSVVLKAILVGGTDTPLLAAWPGSPGGVSYPPGYLAIYLAFVPAQELIFRGFLQSCLRSFFVSRHRAIEANLATNLVFFVTHLHLSVPLGIAAFVAGLVWGQLYERQNSLVGVSVAHALVGFWSFAVLGLPGFY